MQQRRKDTKMFTGLVELRATVKALISDPPGVRLIIHAPQFAAETRIGDSIAVNGCCLTVVEVSDTSFGFDAGAETLSRTNLGRLSEGSFVNLERSLKLGDKVGGHFVTGHIDGQGHLDQRIDDKDWSTFWFRVPETLTLQMASKGSIAVDGVSLTLVDVESDRFSVALIPHTLDVTTLGPMRVGDPVNLETDVLAKYVERQLRGGGDQLLDGPFAKWSQNSKTD
jgi:riboflavin synthase